MSSLFDNNLENKERVGMNLMSAPSFQVQEPQEGW